MRQEIVIVLYHHIADRGDALTSQLDVSTKSEVFERHIRYFARNFDFVSGTDLIGGVLPRKPILVTFDDAYRSVLDIGGPILKSVNAPSLFFINPATVIGDTLPLDNVLSFAIEELGFKKVLSVLNLDQTNVTSTAGLIATIGPRMNKAKVAAAKERLYLAASTTEREVRRTANIFLDPADFKTLPGVGIEVGNHSMSHMFFRALSRDELNTEIIESRALLERLSGQPIRHLSIPYGNCLDATETALDLARSGGHEAIFLVHAKSNRFPLEPDIFYRISLGNVPPEKLHLRLSVMPMMRSLRDWLW